MPVNPGDLFSGIERVKAELKKMPLLAGAEAERFFLDNFKLQGFQGDSGLEKWAPRSHNLDPRRNILRKTGKLKQGIKKTVTSERISVGVVGPAEKYADIHNLGGTIKIEVTAKMKRWAWANYYQLAGQQEKAAGKRSGEHRQTSGLIGMYKAIALKKVGSVVTVKIPQRKFIGNSKQLDNRLMKLAEDRIRAAIKQ